jgi:hypothetical protein
MVWLWFGIYWLQKTEREMAQHEPLVNSLSNKGQKLMTSLQCVMNSEPDDIRAEINDTTAQFQNTAEVKLNFVTDATVKFVNR